MSTALWLTRSCVTPGCNTTIRWPYTQPQGDPVCKYCHEQARREAEDAQDPTITHEP